MKVRVIQSIASPDFSYAPKQVIEIDEHHANAWIASGICEAVEEQTEEAPQQPEEAPAQPKRSRKK